MVLKPLSLENIGCQTVFLTCAVGIPPAPSQTLMEAEAAPQGHPCLQEPIRNRRAQDGFGKRWREDRTAGGGRSPGTGLPKAYRPTPAAATPSTRVWWTAGVFLLWFQKQDTDTNAYFREKLDLTVH